MSRTPNRTGPDDAIERMMLADGTRPIAGVDEAGRGPIAGPVVAAAVILPVRGGRVTLEGADIIDDSKKLTAKRRETAYRLILAQAEAIGIAGLCAATIDESDIRKASLEAMRRALEALAIVPGACLIDGRDVPDGLPLSIRAKTIIGGDAVCLSIAAASIVAKVTRDRMMDALGRLHGGYGLERHRGYGSAAHRRAVADHGGIARVHRFTFRPLK